MTEAKRRQLVLFGDSAFAQIAYEYFTHDSDYAVAAFTVSREYLSEESLFGLPVVAFEEVAALYPPKEHDMFVALTYGKMNRIRQRFYSEAKQAGYTMANYISSRASVWKNVEMGDNVFIFENNTVQPFVTIGSNTILWSGNHIGHHSQIGEHCFISSHVVVSGFCTVGHNCFLGVNATVNNNVSIGDNSLIGSGCLISKDTEPNSVYRQRSTKPLSVSVQDVDF
jgi:sugar O-acyltransferase (sialic acid O-acetyltransferase NeuD family)